MGYYKKMRNKWIAIISIVFLLIVFLYLAGVAPFERKVKFNKAVLTNSGVLINISNSWASPTNAFFCGVEPDAGRHYTESNLIQGYGSLDGIDLSKNDIEIEIGFFEENKKDYFKKELIEMVEKYDTIYCKLVQITAINLESNEFSIKTKDIIR